LEKQPSSIAVQSLIVEAHINPIAFRIPVNGSPKRPESKAKAKHTAKGVHMCVLTGLDRKTAGVLH